MEFITTRRITERYSKQRIDLFLSKEYHYLSRTEWQKEIARGKMSCNGEVITGYDKIIKTGDVITYAGRDSVEPAVDANYTVLYEDKHLLAVNKPGNLPVHPAGIFYHNTLISILQKQYQHKLYLLHRLDRETSGVIILAKNDSVASEISKDFNTVKKTYIALVHGVPEKDVFTTEVPIRFDTGSGIEHKRIAHTGAGERACTIFIRIASFNGFSLLKAVPRTGRQHQIRVHLKYEGYPIVGDKLYGCDETIFHEFIKKGPTDEIERKAGFRRSALHSRSLTLWHPMMHKKICIKAPLQDDMKALIQEKWYCNV